MPIQVTCPGCLKRFSVSEKFAGKQGPCPSCKQVITIPNPEEEVVIHAPEHSEAGAMGAGGRHTLKTLRKKDTKFQPIVFAAIAGVTLVVLVVAFLLRGSSLASSMLPSSVAAIVLGPVLAWAGYIFLHDSELEPYMGTSLLIRAIICGLVYAFLWGLFVFLGEQLFADKSFATPLELEIYELAILSGVVLGIGTFAAYVTFDLEPFSGFFDCALFFAVTILLRLVVGLPALPGLVSG